MSYLSVASFLILRCTFVSHAVPLVSMLLRVRILWHLEPRFRVRQPHPRPCFRPAMLTGTDVRSRIYTTPHPSQTNAIDFQRYRNLYVNWWRTAYFTTGADVGDSLMQDMQRHVVSKLNRLFMAPAASAWASVATYTPGASADRTQRPRILPRDDSPHGEAFRQERSRSLIQPNVGSVAGSSRPQGKWGKGDMPAFQGSCVLVCKLYRRWASSIRLRVVRAVCSTPFSPLSAACSHHLGIR